MLTSIVLAGDGSTIKNIEIPFKLKFALLRSLSSLVMQLTIGRLTLQSISFVFVFSRPY